MLCQTHPVPFMRRTHPGSTGYLLPKELEHDQYPVVLISGGTLAASVRKMAQANFGGDLGALLQATIDGYGEAVTHRRPEEVLSI